MFDVFRNRLELSGTLKTVTALRVSQGRSTEPTGSDLPVVKDALGQPLIPGSSFKGAMRSRLESFLRGIDATLAIDPTTLSSSNIIEEVARIKEAHKKDDAQLTIELVKLTDAASSIFGSPWQASKFQVRDLMVVPDSWFSQYQERDGVAIDRDTETAADGKLYDYQVVPAGTMFTFQALIENAEEWELGLVSIGLHQFETEQIPLGGANSRGLGVVRLENLQMRWLNACQDGKRDPDPVRVTAYLQSLVTGEAQAAFKDGAEYREQWGQALIDQLPSLVKPQLTSLMTIVNP